MSYEDNQWNCGVCNIKYEHISNDSFVSYKVKYIDRPCSTCILPKIFDVLLGFDEDESESLPH